MTQYNNELVQDMCKAGEPLGTRDNAALHHAITNGDPETRQRMIEGNMPLVVTKVNVFLGNWPGFSHLRDDLMSAGFMGLVKAVNKMAGGMKVKNPTAYLGSSINRELGYLLESETPVHLPHTSRRLAQKNGETLDAPAVTNDLSGCWEVPICAEEVDMRDLLDACCICEDERAFLRMREARHTYAEIARALGRPLTSTYAMGRGLEARVMEKLESTR